MLTLSVTTLAFLASSVLASATPFPEGQIPIDTARVLPSFKASLLNCYSFPPRRQSPNAAVCEVIAGTDTHSQRTLLYSPDTTALTFYEATSKAFKFRSDDSILYRTHFFDDYSHPTQQIQIDIPDGDAGDDLPAYAFIFERCPAHLRDPSFARDLSPEYIPSDHDHSPIPWSEVLDVLPRNHLLKQSILDIDPDFTSTFIKFVQIEDSSPYAVLRILVAEDIFLAARYLHTAYLFAILYGEYANVISSLPSEQLQDPLFRNWDITSMIRISHSSYDILAYTPLPSQSPSTSLFTTKLLQWESDHTAIILNLEPPVSRLTLYEEDSSRVVDIQYVLNEPKDILPVAIELGNRYELLFPRKTVSPRQLYEKIGINGIPEIVLSDFQLV